MTGGIFDGFEDYRTPTEEDYRRTLTGGMVVVDANVLLDLYRFNSTTRGDLIKVMQSLGDSLWIPHQVQREFWRNRESVIDQLGQVPKESLAKLDKAHKEAEEAVRAWSNRISLPDGERASLLAKLNDAFQTVRSTISQQSASDAHSQDTNSDLIVGSLISTLADRIGPALSSEDHDAAVIEAERRIAAQEPPGYLDKDKPDPNQRAGDYLVWKQILLEAEQRPRDVLLVTGDTKEDWWRRTKGQLRGPRLELMAEFRRHTGHRLFMITPAELIRRAGALTNVQVNPQSADDIERIESSRAVPVPPEVARGVVAEIYRRIAKKHKDTLPSSTWHRSITEWIDDPAIGGVLSEYLVSEEEARKWLTGVLVSHSHAFYGMGPYADLVAVRLQTADEIVETACGPEWKVRPGTKNTAPPYQCFATDGTNTRFVCWGYESRFEELLAAAKQKRDVAPVRPMMVLTHVTTTPADPEYHTSIANKAGIDLCYLREELSPNPDYAG